MARNKAVIDFEDKGLLDFDQWYTSEAVTYLTDLNKSAELLRYVFLDSFSDKTPKEAFETQLRSIRMLSNALAKGVAFICKEPGVGQDHFIFGILIDNNLILINPVGRTTHQDFYEIVGKIAKDLGLDVYLSNIVIQREAGKLVSCGPICVELMRHLSLLPRGEISAFLNSLTSAKYNLNFREIDISSILPSSLQKIPDDQIEYKKAIERIREHHLEILAQSPEISELDLEGQNAFFTNIVPKTNSKLMFVT
jgi:hypothetical protein